MSNIKVGEIVKKVYSIVEPKNPYNNEASIGDIGVLIAELDRWGRYKVRYFNGLIRWELDEEIEKVENDEGRKT